LNLQASNFGFGNAPDWFQIQIQPDSQSNSLASKSPRGGSVEVRLEAVDAFAVKKGIQLIDLLKIDVEGFKLQVLQGALGMLRYCAVRHIFTECVFAPDSVHPHTGFSN
jgi:FkbM family methyltransferase